MENSFCLPVSFLEMPQIALLSARICNREKREGSSFDRESLIGFAVFHVWVAWARDGSVSRSLGEDRDDGGHFVELDWAVVLWAQVRGLGLWQDLQAMCFDLFAAKVLLDSGDGFVSLAGYGELNAHRDPLHVSRSRKGGHLRHFARHQKDAREDASKRLELVTAADMALPFASDADATPDEQRACLELCFGLKAALDAPMDDASAQELAAALHVVRTISAQAVEAAVRDVTAHRSRPDIAGRPLVELLSGFESLAAILSGA